MSSYIQGGYGFQRLIDAKQRYDRAGFPVYLRLRNFQVPANNQLWAQMGFTLTSPSGSNVGTTDILIDPQPSAIMISLHDIGQSEGKLRFGARTFAISASFVDVQQAAQNLPTQRAVWEGPNVVGLITEGLVFSIEDIAHEEWQGKTTTWILTCNANTQK